MAKLDIIIPTFHAEKTLDRVMASIYMQTIKDEISVYVVNDCDGINYSAVLSKWDLDITYLETPKNGGAGTARQYGLDHSYSEYVLFIDGDDCLASAFACELLWYNAKSKDADMVCGAFDNDFRTDGKFAVSENEHSTTWLHGKLFKRQFLNEHDIRFRSDLRTNEDCYFNQLFLSYEPNAITINKVCYSWLWTNGSLTRTGAADNRFWILYDYIQAAEEYIDEVSLRNITDKAVVLKMIADDLMIIYRYYNEILDSYNSDYAGQYLRRCKEYYLNALSRVPKALDDEILTISNMNVLKNVEFTSRIPSVSIPEFAKMIMS